MQKNAISIGNIDKSTTFSTKHTTKELLKLPGMNKALALQLADRNIYSLEELADQGIDDLSDIETLDSNEAGALIMAARNICWFSNKT